MMKTMLLGTVLLTVVFGATGRGNEAKDTVENLTNEQIIAAYIEKEDGIETDRIEIYEMGYDYYNDEGEHYSNDEYASYLAYDEDGKVVFSGGVDLSWAKSIINE